jgi:hypothetical protein
MQLLESVAAPATLARTDRARHVRRAVLRPHRWRIDPRRFGRSKLLRTAEPPPPPRPRPSLSYEFKLFAVTFLAGFLFISILLG